MDEVARVAEALSDIYWIGQVANWQNIKWITLIRSMERMFVQSVIEVKCDTKKKGNYTQ